MVDFYSRTQGIMRNGPHPLPITAVLSMRNCSINRPDCGLIHVNSDVYYSILWRDKGGLIPEELPTCATCVGDIIFWHNVLIAMSLCQVNVKLYPCLDNVQSFVYSGLMVLSEHL